MKQCHHVAKTEGPLRITTGNKSVLIPVCYILTIKYYERLKRYYINAAKLHLSQQNQHFIWTDR